MKGFKAILLKEFRQVFRDFKTLIFILLMPVILVLLFGYTIKNEINNANIAVLDYDNSQLSRQIINKLSSSNYFTLKEYLRDDEEIEKVFQSENIRALLVFPTHFEQDYLENKTAKIEAIVDASDLNVSTTITNYLSQVINNLNNSDEQLSSQTPIDVCVKMQYNPQLESAYMFIPGNIALVMILISALMTSITLSKERELGSWRLLSISPPKQLVLVLGKITPYICISLFCTAIVLILGVTIFGMPMNGNFALLVLLCVLFMLTSCSLGVLVSVFADSQQVAMLLCMLGFFLPTLLLSGFIFPIENMPIPLQIFSHFVPAKWFIIALRDIMIKGAGLELLWLPVTILTGLTVALITTSVWRLSRKNV